MTAFGPGFTCAGLLLERAMMWPSIALLAFVTLQRLVELPLSRTPTPGACWRAAAMRSRRAIIR